MSRELKGAVKNRIANVSVATVLVVSLLLTGMPASALAASAQVRVFYGESFAGMSSAAFDTNRRAENLEAPYSVLVDCADMAALLVGAGYAGIAGGSITAPESNELGASSGIIGLSSASSQQCVAVGVTPEIVSQLGTFVKAKRIARTGSISSASSFAAAAYRAKGKIGVAEEAQWGDVALLCPERLPSERACIAAFAYAAKAPVFFSEPDGTVSPETLSCLGEFAEIVVPGGADVTPAETVAAVETTTESTVTRVGKDAFGMGAFSVAVAQRLVEQGAATLDNVAVVAGADPLNVTTGLTHVGYKNGIVLLANSVADLKAIASFLQGNRSEVGNVLLFEDEESSLGWDDLGNLKRALQGNFFAEELELADGDTFAVGGCVFKRVSPGYAQLVSCSELPCPYKVGDMVAFGDTDCKIDSIPGSMPVQSEWKVSCAVGDEVALDLRTADSTALKTFSAADTAIAEVTGDGILTAKRVGDTTVSVRATGATGSFLARGELEVHVTQQPDSNHEQAGKPETKDSQKVSSTTAFTSSSAATAGSYKLDAGGTGVVLIKSAVKGRSASVNSVAFGGKSYPVTAIASGAFKNKKNLVKVVLGKKVKTIGASAFANCAKLSSVSGGANVTSIGKLAFSGCKKLKGFTIGKKVKKVGAKAFKGCKKLKKIKVASAKLAKTSCRNLVKGSSIGSIKLSGTGKQMKKKYQKRFPKKVGNRKLKIG